MAIKRFRKCLVINNIDNSAKFGIRHLQVVLLFFLTTLAYAMRGCLSVGIVAMTDREINSNFPTYNWNNKHTILSSFFWGYVVSQTLTGIIVNKTGTYWLLLVSMFLCSLGSVLIPVAASGGSWAVIICRVFQGLAQGVFFPCCHAMLSKWAPPSERSILGTLTFAGNSFGTIISMPTSGWIANSNAGWPTIFYFFGALGFLWCIFWGFLGCENPQNHKKITKNERDYIVKSLGSIGNDDVSSDIRSIPWLPILRSMPVWAIFVSASSHHWGFFTLLTEMPGYLNAIHNFNISQNGLLSACPFLAMWIMSFVFGSMTDTIINRKLVSTGVGRKIANSINQFGTGLFIILLGALGHLSSGIALALLIVAIALDGAHISGFMVNIIDLSPNYTALVMSLTNGLSQIFSIIGPLIVQYLVIDSYDYRQWANVFYVCGGIFFFGGSFYVVFASGERQTWDEKSRKKTNLETTI